MSQRIGPSVWARLWNNMTRMITKQTEKVIVGQDVVGNQYYEYKGARSDRTNIQRGYDQTDPNASKPAIEWESWLKGTRRFPPSDEEIQLNRLRQQKQLEQDSVTERRAPKIGSSGKGAGDIDRPKQYPTYDDMEISPGAKKSDNN
uniref:NADH dehydrogenase [ubiquinone] 1 alpha subcomplex subunit 12 n=1 Tax=Panagrolaimus sp. ES5 TaxID=591445 RepID=A0AC34GSQ1_9BILA